MFNIGRPALPAYALQILRPVWIEDKPTDLQSQHDMVWSGQGLHGVSIHARRDGFIIFDFSQSASYSGGEVPNQIPEPGMRMPQNILDAQERRAALRYQRLQYMNAFLPVFILAIQPFNRQALRYSPQLCPQRIFRRVSRRAEAGRSIGMKDR